MPNPELMGPDNEYIHCTRLNEDGWKRIADTGGKVSIAAIARRARLADRRHVLPPCREQGQNFGDSAFNWGGRGTAE